MQPLSRKLMAFTYIKCPAHLQLTPFFGSVRMSNLKYIFMSSEGLNASRFLSADNFTGLPVIESISLHFFGIELILEHTFDFIGETLDRIYLSCNNIKHLTYTLFAIFLNSQCMNQKALSIVTADIECDCDFYELRNMSLIALKYPKSLVDYLEFYTCRNEWPTIEKCPASQQIHSRSVCLELPYFELFAYPEFNVHAVDDELIIETMAAVKYRLLIINHSTIEKRKSTKCPSKFWANQSVKCFQFSRLQSAIAINQTIWRSDLMTIYIIYVSAFNEVWPLHIRSMRIEQSEWIIGEFIINALLCFCCVLPLSILLGLFIGCQKTKSKLAM